MWWPSYAARYSVQTPKSPISVAASASRAQRTRRASAQRRATERGKSFDAASLFAV
jgi:hypothetical protein